MLTNRKQSVPRHTMSTMSICSVHHQKHKPVSVMVRTRNAAEAAKRGPCEKKPVNSLEKQMKEAMLTATANEMNALKNNNDGRSPDNVMLRILEKLRKNELMKNCTRDAVNNHKRKLEKKKGRSNQRHFCPHNSHVLRQIPRPHFRPWRHLCWQCRHQHHQELAVVQKDLRWQQNARPNATTRPLSCAQRN